MVRPALEVADIFRAHGPAWRAAQHTHLSLAQVQHASHIFGNFTRPKIHNQLIFIQDDFWRFQK